MIIEQTRVDERFRILTEREQFVRWRRVYAPGKNVADLFERIDVIQRSHPMENVREDCRVFVHSDTVEEYKSFHKQREDKPKFSHYYQRYAKLSPFGEAVRLATVGAYLGSIEIKDMKPWGLDGLAAIFKYSHDHIGEVWTCVPFEGDIAVERACPVCQVPTMPYALDKDGVCVRRSDCKSIRKWTHGKRKRT